MIMGNIKDRNIFLRSCLSMGWRSVLSCLSSSVGGGIFSSNQAKRRNGSIKMAPVSAGIQNSETFKDVISKSPTDFTTPLETIKLEHSATPNISVSLRPSKYENTIRQTKPNGNPLKNIKAIV